MIRTRRINSSRSCRRPSQADAMATQFRQTDENTDGLPVERQMDVGFTWVVFWSPPHVTLHPYFQVCARLCRCGYVCARVCVFVRVYACLCVRASLCVGKTILDLKWRLCMRCEQAYRRMVWAGAYAEGNKGTDEISRSWRMVTCRLWRELGAQPWRDAWAYAPVTQDQGPDLQLASLDGLRLVSERVGRIIKY